MGLAAEDLGFSVVDRTARLTLVSDYAAVSTGAGRRHARLVGHRHRDGECLARTCEQAFVLSCPGNLHENFPLSQEISLSHPYICVVKACEPVAPALFRISNESFPSRVSFAFSSIPLARPRAN